MPVYVRQQYNLMCRTPGDSPMLMQAEDDEIPAEYCSDTQVYKLTAAGEKVLTKVIDYHGDVTWQMDQAEYGATEWAEIELPCKEGESLRRERIDWDTLWPQVETLKAEGKTGKQIAAALEIDESTLRMKIARMGTAARKARKLAAAADNPELAINQTDLPEWTEGLLAAMSADLHDQVTKALEPVFADLGKLEDILNVHDQMLTKDWDRLEKLEAQLIDQDSMAETIEDLGGKVKYMGRVLSVRTAEIDADLSRQPLTPKVTRAELTALLADVVITMLARVE